MNTFLGAAQFLPEAAVDEAIAAAGILYLEGYCGTPIIARRDGKAIATARDAGRKVAFTLSDGFVVERHRDEFGALIDDGQIDILFANENEIRRRRDADRRHGRGGAAARCRRWSSRWAKKGALAIAAANGPNVAAEPIDKLVDTTGAGNLFAAGFLPARRGA